MTTITESNFKTKYNAGVSTEDGNWINLHRNENLFIDENVIKGIVLKAVNETSILKYPDPNITKLRERLAEFHGVLPENIFVGNGADEVLSSLFYLFRKRFEKINMPRICFKMYDTFSAKYDFTVNQFANFPTLSPDSVFENSGLFLIDSPCSITGNVIDKSIFSQLLANQENMVIWDNVHGDFCGDTFTGLQDNLVVIKHFSHYYGLASLRIGYCIASKEIVDEMNLYREPFSVNSIAQASAIECLNKHDYFVSVSNEVKKSKKIFENELNQLQFQICKSVVNFVLVKHDNIDSEVIHQALAARKIATRYYADDCILNEYLRIAIPPQNDMDKVIRALKEIVYNGG